MNKIKEKYSECISILSKTQEELALLRESRTTTDKKRSKRYRSARSNSFIKYNNTNTTNNNSNYYNGNESSNMSDSYYLEPSVSSRDVSTSRFSVSNGGGGGGESFATEVYNTMLRDTRDQNTFEL